MHWIFLVNDCIYNDLFLKLVRGIKVCMYHSPDIFIYLTYYIIKGDWNNGNFIFCFYLYELFNNIFNILISKVTVSTVGAQIKKSKFSHVRILLWIMPINIFLILCMPYCTINHSTHIYVYIFKFLMKLPWTWLDYG